MNTLAIVGPVLGGIVAAIGVVVVARLQSRSTPFGDMAAALKDERDRGDKQDGRIESLERDLRGALRRLDSMDADMSILIDDLSAQETWQTTGAPPPPPAISPRALVLLRAHRQTRLNAAPPPV